MLNYQRVTQVDPDINPCHHRGVAECPHPAPERSGGPLMGLDHSLGMVEIPPINLVIGGMGMV